MSGRFCTESRWLGRVTTLSESDFQAQLIDVARALGWRVAHFRAARTAHGWRVPVAADGAGFPDLLLVRERVVVAELKAAKGRVTAEQEAWLEAFRFAGVEAFIWHPGDFDEAVAVLRRRAAARS